MKVLLHMSRRVPGNAIPGLGLAMTLMINSAIGEPHEALCRVNNRLAAFNNVGSGTLIDRSDDGREGLVLTCAHLFSEGVGEVVVSFPGGKTHGAKLVAIDREADLAALAISNPANAGKLMQSGLWHYSRHPNYFGEVTQWWGIWLMVLALPGGVFALVGPLTITFLILRVSGVPLLEAKMTEHPDFAEYRRRTSLFIPLPPRA